MKKFAEDKDAILAEVGNIMFPVEANTEPGTFCFYGTHREMSMSEWQMWNHGHALPIGCTIHRAPSKVLENGQTEIQFA
jgi:hypothetical protein